MRVGLFLLLSAAVLFAQAPPATLDGDIVNSVTGAPIPSARIKLVVNKGQPQYATADAAGHFHFDAVSSGAYTLAVDHPAYLAYSSSGKSPASSTLKVPLVAGAIIYGSVTDPNGLPAMSGGAFTVQIYRPADGKSELATVSNHIMVDDRGQYRSDLLSPGTYYIAVIALNAPYFIWVQNWRSTFYPHSLNLETAKAIQLAAGQEVRADIQVMEHPGITAGGHVTVPAYDAAPAGTQIATWVHLVPQVRLFGASSGNVTVVNDRFEAQHLLPGKYTLMAESLLTNSDRSTSKYLFGASHTVEIGERDASNLDIELQPLPPITGTVTFADGCATRPIPVHLRGGGMMGIQTFSTLSAADGSFSFDAYHPSPMLISTGVGEAATIYQGDRDITRTGFDYPTPTPQAVRIVVRCATGGAQ